MKRKIFSVILAISVVVAYSVPCFATEEIPVEGDLVIDCEELEEPNNVEEVSKLELFVKEVDESLEYKDGVICLDNVNLDSLSETYGEEIVDSMTSNIDNLNELSEEGELKITDNGTIYDPEDENLYIQGKLNVNKSSAKWYGCLMYRSYKKANSLKTSLKSVTTATGCASLIAFNPETFLASAVLGAISAYTNEWVKSITKYNKKDKGIKYKLYWVGAYTMRTQGTDF